mmetsp:Transcript_5796/g.12876  ORF Transcript_5796/g.12876 Transcript_5796/m.12876 type:complete len:354 (+) Transcript_5796:129-1190(+)
MISTAITARTDVDMIGDPLLFDWERNDMNSSSDVVTFAAPSDGAVITDGGIQEYLDESVEDALGKFGVLQQVRSDGSIHYVSDHFSDDDSHSSGDELEGNSSLSPCPMEELHHFLQDAGMCTFAASNNNNNNFATSVNTASTPATPDESITCWGGFRISPISEENRSTSTGEPTLLFFDPNQEESIAADPTLPTAATVVLSRGGGGGVKRLRETNKTNNAANNALPNQYGTATIENASKIKRCRKCSEAKRQPVSFQEMQRLMDVYGPTKSPRKRASKEADTTTGKEICKKDSIKRKFYRWFEDFEERFELKENGVYVPKVGHLKEIEYRKAMRSKHQHELIIKRMESRFRNR